MTSPAAAHATLAPGEPEPAARTNWPMVALLVGCGVVGAFQVGKVPPALPALREELALGLAAAGWVMSTLSVVAALLGMFAGAVIDRVGARRLILAGLAVTAMGSFLGAAAPGTAVLVVSRAIEGVGFLALIIGLPTLLLRFVSMRDRGLVMGLWGAFMPAGIALSMLFAPLIVQGLGWRALWVTIGCAVIGVCALFARAVTEAGAGAGAAVPGGLVRVLRSPAPLLLGVCFGCFSAQHISVLSFIPLWLVEQRGYGLLTAAAVAALVTAVNVPGNLLGGWLLLRGVAAWKLIGMASLVMAPGALAAYHEGLSDGWRFVAVLLFSGAGGLIPVSLFHSVPRYAPAPQLVGTCNGVLVQLNNTGQLTGPPALAALVAAAGTWSAAPAMLVGLAAVVLVCALALRRFDCAARE